MIEVEAPDGTRVQFPDGTPPDVMTRAMRQKFGGPPEPQPAPPASPSAIPSFMQGFEKSITGRETPVTEADVAAHRKRADDVVRSVASGASFGLADEAAAAGNTLVGDKGYSENLAAERERDKSIPLAVKIPGEVAGGVLTGTGLARQGLSLLNAAKPTIASMATRGGAEGALYGAAHGFGHGEGTQDRLEGAARGGTIGAVTGAGTGAIASKFAPRSEPVPTTEQLRTQAQAAYQKAEQAGVVVSKESFGDLVDSIASSSRMAGIDKTIHPNATAALKRLAEAKGTEPTVAEMDILRRVLRGAASSQNADERRIAGLMIDKLDDYIGNLSPKDVIAGDPAKAANALMEARGMWSRMKKSEVVEDLVERAKISAQGFSGSGYENALRTEFRNLAKSANRMRGFSEAEQDAIRKVAEGGPMENALRFVGKLAPRGVVSGGFNLGIGAAIDPTAGMATMMAGEAGRRGATALTSRNASLASEIMRAGGKLPDAGPLTPLQLKAVEAAIIAQAQQSPPLARAIRERLSTGR